MSSLSDEAWRRHQAFAYPMAWLGRRWLLGLLLPRGDRFFLGRAVILLFSLPLWCPFFGDLRSWGRPFLPCLHFLVCRCCPYQCPLFSCLHFCKGQVTGVRQRQQKEKTNKRNKVITYTDRSKYLIYMLQALALDHHNKCATYQGWSNPYTSVARMGFQEPDEWKPLARQLCAD